MNFRTFKQNKLIRDNILQLMQNNGSKLYWFELNDQDFQKQLKIKLVEESLEVQRTQNSIDLTEELADVLEIVYSLAKSHGLSAKDLEQARLKKQKEKGGYEQKIFLSFAEHPKDSPQERYCLADPDKYPEVKNNN
ncbi:nucleoside triphosphate pyrophosphohydrolase [Candidatus Babeliales bacterium]|nr:nucleoside triphosphate pyrophosphohydrolase [Candidatus Babeliales bacterium]